MSLYNKYRPDSLNKVFGNESAIKSLKAVLEKEDKPHAFLFSGPKGCGKTTLGRIVKSHLGVSDTDFIELDSADFRGIDTVRAVRRNAGLGAMSGKYRLWLFDEVHQFSKDAQTALLKLLEEPPPHAFFVLCTTDPQKLLPTVRDRCTSIVVQPLKDDQMKKLLQRVCKKEQKHVTEDVLDQIIHDACGSARAALVVLESVMDLNADDMMEAAQQKMMEENDAIEICRALFEKTISWTKVGSLIQKNDTDPESVRRLVMSYCNSILMKKADNRAAIIMEHFEGNFYDNGKPALTLACYRVFTDSN